MNGNVFKPKPISLTEQLSHTMKDGRVNLGNDMPVFVYRLFQFTMRDVLIDAYGEDTAIDLFRKSGYSAGQYLARNSLNLEQPFNAFVAQLQSVLLELKVGVLRIEEFDESTGRIVLAVAEDLDCSGLPILGVPVCHYDEGFIAGILDEYTKQNYTVREVDCWATGDRVCRFEALAEGK